MTYDEAMKQVFAGKRVRYGHWPDSTYTELHQGQPMTYLGPLMVGWQPDPVKMREPVWEVIGGDQ